MKKILILQHEQRQHFSLEPGHLELALPISKSHIVYEYPYQRLVNRQYDHTRKKRICDFEYLEKHSKFHAVKEISINFMKNYFLYNIGDEKKLTIYDQSPSPYILDFNLKTSDLLQLDLRSILKIFKPDIVLLSVTRHDECINPELLYNLIKQSDKKIYFIIIQYDYDDRDPSFLEFERKSIIYSDKYLICDSLLRAKRIKRKEFPYIDYIETDKVAFHPLPIDPDQFYVSPTYYNRVSLTGSSEEQRDIFFNAVIESGLPYIRVGGNMPKDNTVSVAKYSSAIRESLIGLNTQTVVHRAQIKGRLLQIIMSGSFLFEQSSEATESFLKGLNYESFSSSHELIDKISYRLKNPEETRFLALETRKNFLEKYNNKSFEKMLLE